MGNRARKTEQEVERWLPPCEQAQADGVPCTEVGRRCEICENAFPPPRDRQEGPPLGPGGEGTLPIA
ncbi:MAG: hypothetical protein ACYTEZ_07265 [Planctomycetota bacterium]|jgi:hypothetical protein